MFCSWGTHIESLSQKLRKKACSYFPGENPAFRVVICLTFKFQIGLPGEDRVSVWAFKGGKQFKPTGS